LVPADYAPVHAYGDSAGDREMLALADEPHYRPFR
jgi:phosphoserine phosphatase